MTAHAMNTDREKCLAAGMDDYVSKPIDFAVFEAVLDRWTCGRAEPREPTAVLAPSQPPSMASGFDSEDLTERMMGNQRVARRVVRSFLNDFPLQLAALSDAVDRADAEGARNAAHSIKGAASNASANRVSQLAAQLEYLSSDGDLSGVAASLQELASRFETSQPEMVKFSSP